MKKSELRKIIKEEIKKLNESKNSTFVCFNHDDYRTPVVISNTDIKLVKSLWEHYYKLKGPISLITWNDEDLQIIEEGSVSSILNKINKDWWLQWNDYEDVEPLNGKSLNKLIKNSELDKGSSWGLAIVDLKKEKSINPSNGKILFYTEDELKKEWDI